MTTKKRKQPHATIHVRGGIVQEVEGKGFTYEVRDYDNCSKCGGVDCEGGHKALEVHGELTGENQAGEPKGDA